MKVQSQIEKKARRKKSENKEKEDKHAFFPFIIGGANTHEPLISRHFEKSQFFPIIILFFGSSVFVEATNHAVPKVLIPIIRK